MSKAKNGMTSTLSCSELHLMPLYPACCESLLNQSPAKKVQETGEKEERLLHEVLARSPCVFMYHLLEKGYHDQVWGHIWLFSCKGSLIRGLFCKSLFVQIVLLPLYLDDLNLIL